MDVYISKKYINRRVVSTNRAVGATGSPYQLIVLQDVIDDNPSLVVIDRAINDVDESYCKAAEEAVIRRLRNALPNVNLIAPYFLQVDDYTVNDPTNLKDAVKQNCEALDALYTIAQADYAAEVARAVGASEYVVSDYFVDDNSHPSNFGHGVAANLLIGVLPNLLTNQTSGELPERIYDNGDYENDPIIRVATDNDGETGSGWSTSGMARVSSTADDTISWTGTFQAVLLDCETGAGSIEYQIDSEGFVALDLSTATKYKTLWTGARGSHSFTIKIVSGTITVNRFLAI